MPEEDAAENTRAILAQVRRQELTNAQAARQLRVSKSDVLFLLGRTQTETFRSVIIGGLSLATAADQLGLSVEKVKEEVKQRQKSEVYYLVLAGLMGRAEAARRLGLPLSQLETEITHQQEDIRTLAQRNRSARSGDRTDNSGAQQRPQRRQPGLRP